MGVMATNAIKSVKKFSDDESVVTTAATAPAAPAGNLRVAAAAAPAAAGTYRIAGSTEATVFSNGDEQYKATNVVTKTAADGSSVKVSDAQDDYTIRNGIYGDTTRTRATSNTTAAGLTTEVVETRVDGVAGTTLSKKAADGKDSKTTVTADGMTATGLVKAGGFDASGKSVVNVGNGVADTDATNVSQMRASSNNAVSAANTYTDSRVSNLGRKLDNVERTAYRGVAIALAAQQAVPNIQPGQVALFGGIGHYEGENAASIGVVTSFNNRVSASGAFGFAGSSSFGGRVGISYLFGGN